MFGVTNYQSNILQCILVNPPQFVLKNIGGLMSLADYPNQFAVFCHNSCTKLMADKRVWRIKRWRINENSLYVLLQELSNITKFLSCN